MLAIASQNERWLARPTGFLLLLFWLLLAPNFIAHAESDGRVSARLTNDWLPPSVEDLDDFLANLPAPKDAPAASRIKPSKINAEIDRVKDLLASGVDKATQNQLRLRLAELYFQAGLEQREDELDRYRTALTNFLNTNARGKQPVADHSKSRKHFLKSLDTFRRLLTTAPAYNGRGDVALQVGRLLVWLKSPNAIPELKKITVDFKDSTFASRAMLLLADLSIAIKKPPYKQARALLTAIKNDAEPIIGSYAQYRLAWLVLQATSTDNSKAQAAIMATFQAIATDECGSKASASRLLCRQVNNDLVYMFANTDKISDAEKYFQQTNNKERYFLTLERAAWLAVRKNNREKAALHYGQLVDLGSERPAMARHSLSLAENLRLAGNAPAVVAALRNMIRTCIDDDGVWIRANKEDKDLIAEAKVNFGKKSVEYADFYAIAYAKQGKPELLAVTNQLLALHLGVFAKSDASDALRKRYAEGLVKEKKLEAAASQYFILANSTSTKTDLRQIAADKMLNLQLQVAGPMPAIEPKGWALQKNQQPLSKGESQLIEIVDLYTKIFPTRPNVAQLQLHAAALHFSHGYANLARERVDALTQTHPSDKATATAVKMTLAYHNERREWGTTIKLSSTWSKNPKLATTRLIPDIRSAWRLALWQQAQSFYGRKQSVEDQTTAARTFTLFAETFPKDQEADQALVLASNIWINQGDGDAAISSCLKLVKLYATSLYRLPCLWSVARIYEQRLEYTKASEIYATYAGLAPRDTKSPEALLLAAELDKDDQNPDLAIVKLKQVIQNYPNTGHAANALFRLAELYMATEQYAEAIKSYNQFWVQFGANQVDRGLEAQATAAVLVTRSNPVIGRPQREKAEAAVRARAPSVGAKARSILAALNLAEARKGRETLPRTPVDESNLNALTKSFQQIRADLKDAETAYAAVIRLGDAEYGIAAHYLVGLLYESVFNAIKLVPRGKSIAPGDITAAVNQREGLILELKAAMNSHWEQGIALAKATKNFVPWGQLTRTKLTQISPKRYSENPEIMLPPKFTSHLITSK